VISNEDQPWLATIRESPPHFTAHTLASINVHESGHPVDPPIQNQPLSKTDSKTFLSTPHEHTPT